MPQMLNPKTHEFYEIACYLDQEHFAKLSKMVSEGQPSPYKGRKTESFGSTAIIPIMGIITRETVSAWLTDYYACADIIVPQIKAAVSNDKVKEIILLMDTPGGGCQACDTISYAVEQAAKSKRVETFVDGLCCSAGIHIAAFSQKITATPGSLVGSVGVISTYYDYSKYLEEFGIETKVLTTGTMKAMGVFGAKITDKQLETRMTLIQDLADEFKLVLMEHRKLTKQQVEVIAEIGDVWVAEKAKNYGLIDAIDRWDNFVTSRATPSISTPIKEEKNMNPKERQAAIIAACKGLDPTKDAAFLLEMVLSEKDISEIAAQWREMLHEKEKAELRAQLESLQKEKEEREKKEPETPPDKAPGGKPLETDAKDTPTGDVRKQFNDAITKIQKEHYAVGDPISRESASRILAGENPKLMQAYKTACMNGEYVTEMDSNSEGFILELKNK